MMLHRNFYGGAALLLIFLLLIVCLGGFDQDATQDDVKGNGASICMLIMDHLRSEGVGECDVVVTSNGESIQFFYGHHGMWQASDGLQHGLLDFQDFILAASDYGFMDCKLPGYWRQSNLQLSADSQKVVAPDCSKLPLPSFASTPAYIVEVCCSTEAQIPSKDVPGYSVFLLGHQFSTSHIVKNSQKTISKSASTAPPPVLYPVAMPPITSKEACLPFLIRKCSPYLRKGSTSPTRFLSHSPQPFSTPVHRRLSFLSLTDISSTLSFKRAFQHSWSYSPLAPVLRNIESSRSALRGRPSILPFPAIVPSVSSLHHLPVVSPAPQPVPWRRIQPPHPSHISSNATPPTSKQHSHRHHHKCRPSLAPAVKGSSANAPTAHYCRHKHPRAPTHVSPGYASGPSPAPQMGPTLPISKPPMARPPMVLPSPPPNPGCAGVSCSVPYTETPFGSPCGCVLPIQVGLEFGVALYALFPLTSVLAEELAYGTLLSQNQVRITGANSEKQNQDKSVVDIDLVPLDEAFDNLTALLIFQKFQNHEVHINETLFGSYAVLYVSYPGLPPSAYPSQPPQDTSDHPLGVDIKNDSNKMHSGTIALIALSSAIAVVICIGTFWFLLLKCSYRTKKPPLVESVHTYSTTKRSALLSNTGGGSMLSSDMASSTSLSFASSIATYTGSAKTFTLAELERATEKFKSENIIGEGGFGRVYFGILDDGTKVAVKVLSRDDQQGGREFISEVEMLSRLHHRNLVKLIGICTEEHYRSLVYELIPNGSVESHLHGSDKVTSPLDWDARMKIALGAARGLAYLHEDSNPRVIHRDFKASNILLENDFTPKVSDFGLAKAAPDKGSGHISTRVMGTFGYVAPEYAMTGHLLVKSDVYSYGVVLLELLTGRKPVDMSQPPGQENLVTWARSLLTSKEGLEVLVDPALGNCGPSDNLAKVATIASMCVQPEVSHRPFMGEVVQALKLVYNDSDTSNGIGSANGSQSGQSPSQDSGVRPGKPWEGGTTQFAPDSTSFISVDYDSGPIHAGDLETERPLSTSAIFSNSEQFLRELSGSFRRHSTSGPLRTNRNRSIWSRLRSIERGSMSEHALTRHFGTGLSRGFYELWP